MKSISRVAILLASLILVCGANRALSDTFGSGVDSFDIEFVPIGSPGNAADTTGDPNPAGAVGYSFRMGKFEISEQMIDKANALGNLGITKDTRGSDKPATSISWNEAARFVNWLNTSTGSAPAYKFAIQPGEPGYNTFQDILLWAPGDPGYNPNNLFRNSRARYFLPSTDEWYKAAYYDAGNNVYYNYPTGSNSAPAPIASGTAAGTAVFDQTLASGPADISQAGGLSPFGTMGQGGNVYEWEETEFDLQNDLSGGARGNRGGAWEKGHNHMLASFRTNGNPGEEGSALGFRVASVPEPNTIWLAVMLIFGTGRRRNRHS